MATSTIVCEIAGDPRPCELKARARGRTPMKFPRRRFLHLAAAAVALPAVLRIARAQSYPNRHVRLVVPFLAGGAQDAIARLLGNRLSEVWGHPVVIENKGGAGGNIAAQAVAQSAPD